MEFTRSECRKTPHGFKLLIDWAAPSSHEQIVLPSSANLLHVTIESLCNDPGQSPRETLIATTADRRLTFVDISEDIAVSRSFTHFQDSPILACVPLGTPADSITLSCSMSGQVVVYDHKAHRCIETRRDHTKYVIKIATCLNKGHLWVATAGWDGKVYIYRVENPLFGLGPPVAELNLPTNPEAIIFINHPATAEQILLVTRRDSTSLYFYRLPVSDASPLELLGTQNLAPHSNAWIAFSPSSVAVCPTDPTIVAIATSAVPHMKLIIVRLLLPQIDAPARSSPEPAPQDVQTRATLAIQGKEDLAILVHVTTLAPQTPYSTPQVVWRPDGTGVWVNGDDGVLRGLEAKTGKIVTLLKDGHESGSKIRSIWCGSVEVQGSKEEWLVSGGFDRRLVVWRPKKEGTG